MCKSSEGAEPWSDCLSDRIAEAEAMLKGLPGSRHPKCCVPVDLRAGNHNARYLELRGYGGNERLCLNEYDEYGDVIDSTAIVNLSMTHQNELAKRIPDLVDLAQSIEN